MPASSEFTDEVRMLHNKINKNHGEVLETQRNLLKVAMDTGKLQLADNMQTKKLSTSFGEVSNSVTIMKGTFFLVFYFCRIKW